MGYTGRTYIIKCDAGGFSYNPNIDAIAPNAMIEPSRNINIYNGYRQPRGGTSKINGTAVSGSPQIMGLIDYILPAGTQFIVFATSDGKIYKNSTTTIKTGLTSNKITNFSIFQNNLYSTNNTDVVQKWDGAAGTTSNITNPAADWVTLGQPIQIVVHGKGNSERMWAVCGTKKIYASAVNSDNFVTGVVAIPLDTKDEYGTIGMVEWKDNLIIFGKRQAFIIDDTSLTTSEWGYDNAPWSGGVGNHRLICKTDNDIICMTIDGDIYSVSAAIQTGDYKASSIARPAFIDRWIRDNIDLSQIDKFHSVYDPVTRRAQFFMVKKATSIVNICLSFNIDRPALEGWDAPYENTGFNSGYNASCAALIRKAIGNNKVYTGDYSGFIWELEKANINDDSNAYYKGFTFPYLTLSADPSMTKHIWKGRIVTEPMGSYNLSINTWVDNTLLATSLISLAGTGAVLDSFILNTDILGGQYLIDSDFPIGEVGKRIKGEFYNNGLNEDFRVSDILIHFRELGVKP